MTDDAGDEQRDVEGFDTGEALDTDDDPPFEDSDQGDSDQGDSDQGDSDQGEPDLGDDVFGGPLDRGPIEPGRPEAENVLFVLVGILLGTLVIMRLIGAI